MKTYLRCNRGLRKPCFPDGVGQMELHIHSLREFNLAKMWEAHPRMTSRCSRCETEIVFSFGFVSGASVGHSENLKPPCPFVDALNKKKLRRPGVNYCNELRRYYSTCLLTYSEQSHTVWNNEITDKSTFAEGTSRVAPTWPAASSGGSSRSDSCQTCWLALRRE